MDEPSSDPTPAPGGDPAGQSDAGSGVGKRVVQPNGVAAGPVAGKGLRVQRHFSRPGVHPFDEIEWELRTASIANEKGEAVFVQENIEVPRSWSQLATNVVVSKYFRGPLETTERERSVRQLIGRVADTIRDWAHADSYFATDEDLDAFHAELCAILVNQIAAFNSPVWFNVGVEPHPQGSACFINSVDDTMASILSLAKTEGMLFKYGSGTGTNLSSIRSSDEKLAGGGTASGPVSFMKGFDAFAGVIKSGGTTRRAAKMVILNADHPDIVEFINCKVNEERKAWALIDAGYDGSFTGEAYGSVFFQNSNNSVRVTDEFMRAVLEDRDWHTYAVTDHSRIMHTFKARDLMRQITDAAWTCGDPGMQFDTTVNEWHTSPNSGRINASNPCFTADTLVHTDRGLIAFSDLVTRLNAGTTFKVYTHEATSPDGPPADAVELTTPEAVMMTGLNRVVKLTFSNGMEIRCTPNHRLWTTNRGYVRATDLLAADSVLTLAIATPARAATRTLPVPADSFDHDAGDDRLPRRLPLEWTEEFAHYLGWLVSQGAVGADGACTTAYDTEADRREIMPRHLALVTAALAGRAPAVATLSDGTQHVRIIDRAFTRHLESLGLRRVAADQTTVPWTILQAPPEIAGAFLRGIFDAVGGVCDGNERGQHIGLESRSRDLTLNVQRLLTSLGIPSTVRSAPGTGRWGSRCAQAGEGLDRSPLLPHALTIAPGAMTPFVEAVGFSVMHKRDSLGVVLGHEPFRARVGTHLASRIDAGTALTYNLSEPRNHSYIANGLVVANCSEYMYLDDSACNLASLNLMKFLREKGDFDVDGYRHTIAIMITAMEVLVGNASYPTERITENSRRFRPLGLGYANLGALLMARGVPYDSPQGRDYSAAVTAVLCGEAYAQSARIAKEVGPFDGYADNRQPMLRVMEKHRAAAYRIPAEHLPPNLVVAARTSWDDAHELGAVHGYRNGQATVLAPTGTIGFLMDCDTTGVEPDIALVKYKKLVGGGLLKIVNNTVPQALRQLGYGEQAVSDIVAHIDAHDTIEGAPHLRGDDLPVFDCAFQPANGTRSIAWQGHVRMMAAVQPFLSGAISKTVNLPQEATPADIEHAYLDAWRMGLKAIAVYRDGSKRSQPLSTSRRQATFNGQADPATDRPARHRLPSERQAITHKFEIQGHEGYITVGLYEDGQPGEIFLKMAKEGSTLSGVMDAFATAVSVALQYGVPLKLFCDKFAHMRFEPSGYTGNREIPIAKSIVDYIFRWLGARFLPEAERAALGVLDRSPIAVEPDASDDARGIEGAPSTTIAAPGHVAGKQLVAGQAFWNQEDAPSCAECGALMVRSGACYKCMNCGATSGCS